MYLAKKLRTLYLNINTKIEIYNNCTLKTIQVLIFINRYTKCRFMSFSTAIMLNELTNFRVPFEKPYSSGRKAVAMWAILLI